MTDIERAYGRAPLAQRPWGKLKEGLETTQPVQTSEGDTPLLKEHWLKERVYGPRHLDGSQSVREKWVRCYLCANGYGHIKH